MRDHAKRVDAGVRAAGTVDALHARKHFTERRLDFFLHARADLLHLPALVSRAVVGDDEFEFQIHKQPRHKDTKEKKTEFTKWKPQKFNSENFVNSVSTLCLGVLVVKFRPDNSATRSPPPFCPLSLCVCRGGRRLGSKSCSPANLSAARPTILSGR